MATGTRFAANNVNAVDQVFGSEGRALGQIEDLANQANLTNDQASISTGSPATFSVTQFVNGVLMLTGSNGAKSSATPTAAAIVAALVNVQVGSSFDFALVNGDSGTVTLTAGTGVTLRGTTAVPTTKSQVYKGVVTNATAGSEAVDVIGLLSTPS